ncbi:MAG: UDP-3-O-(3-hydroxymyristoyl)glucosamine N-acyltransferase [Planctomycetota bacterium]
MTTAEPRHRPPFTAAQLAEHLGAELAGDGDVSIERLGAVDTACDKTLTFVRDASYAEKFTSSNAAAALAPKSLQLDAPGGRAVLNVSDPDIALIAALELFATEKPAPLPGAHPSATIDPSAAVSAEASIGPSCVVGPDATIGARAILGPGTVVGAGASIGDGTELRANVCVLDGCTVGPSCIIHPGVVIGSDGFGYRFDPARGHVKIPHLGAVTIGAHVEIGANTCIDRGKFGDTRIGNGVKIDNLVQIGHNCDIGDLCILCGQVGLSGSVTVGAGSVLGGQAGVADNLTIAPQTRLGGQAGVMGDVGPGDFAGAPAVEGRQARANLAAMRNVGDLARRIKALEKALRDSQRG